MCSQEPEPGSDGFSAALKLTAVFGNRIEKNTEICKNKFWFQDLNGLEHIATIVYKDRKCNKHSFFRAQSELSC